MRKFGILILMILISTILAGIYGAIHDQITYSISSEYFTVYKFDQFGFQDWGNNNPRMTTALIGFLTTWWVGFYIGIFQSLIGLMHKGYKQMFSVVFKAVLITLGTAILFGVIGFFVGKIQYSGANIDCCFPYSIIDKHNFMVVGSIHNYGYMGGEIGAVIAILYQILQRRKANR